jgi:hypothetical protein
LVDTLCSPELFGGEHTDWGTMPARLEAGVAARLGRRVAGFAGNSFPTTLAELLSRSVPIRAAAMLDLRLALNIAEGTAQAFVTQLPDHPLADARTRHWLREFVRFLAFDGSLDAIREIDRTMQLLSLWGDAHRRDHAEALFEECIRGLIECRAIGVLTRQLRTRTDRDRCAAALVELDVEPDEAAARIAIIVGTKQWSRLADLEPAEMALLAEHLPCDSEDDTETLCRIIAKHGPQAARDAALEAIKGATTRRALFKSRAALLGFDPDRTVNLAPLEQCAQRVQGGAFDLGHTLFHGDYAVLRTLENPEIFIWPWIDEQKSLCGDRILQMFQPLLHTAQGWSHLVGAAVVRSIDPAAPIDVRRCLLPVMRLYAGREARADGREEEILAALNRMQHPFRYDILDQAAIALSRAGLSAAVVRTCIDAVVLHRYFYHWGSDGEVSHWMLEPGLNAVRRLALGRDELFDETLELVSQLPDATGYYTNPTLLTGRSETVSMEARRDLARTLLDRRRRSWFGRIGRALRGRRGAGRSAG